MRFTLIQNGKLYTPDVLEAESLLMMGQKIVAVGDIDAGALQAAGLKGED